MSTSHSASVSSASSTISETTLTQNDLANDSSNLLYENRDHFQSIFSNDSRFFDTSLHLYKSYVQLGYIQLTSGDNARTIHVPSPIKTSNGRRHRLKVRLLKLTDTDSPSGTIKAFLTPTILRKNDNSNRDRSNSSSLPNETKSHERKSSMLVQFQRTSASTQNNLNEDNIEESDIIITRL